MTSSRNKAEDDDEVTGRILDAARELVIAFGLRRTTATDVARRADVSRMTFYRRFPDIQRVLAALLTRESAVLFAEVADHGTGTARQRLCATTLAVVRRLSTDPLLNRVLEVDPEVLLPYLRERTGASQRMFLDLLVAAITAGHADGSVRECDPELAARNILLMVQVFVMSWAITLRESDPEGALAELGIMLDHYLAPGLSERQA
ncbi:TetR/AcrR family transcriptional regulator [Rhodococcus sp. X156]|uniref:TetR/AcrR family transcriptional regulator n=1 Tax=Rhodococcus sp. X156 TaxID=2499145 RepID=UPI000FD7A3C5|nr:TetR/AcrR family transcriptional regulator [Rhodococcus sp. X156]